MKYFYILKLHKFKQPPKHLITLFSQPKTLIVNTQFIISMKLRKSFVSININRTWLNKEKLVKNTFNYQNLIVFS